MDEAGRGPLAGPVVAAAVVLRVTGFAVRIADSKQLTPRARERADAAIRAAAWVGLGVVDVITIDRLNILRASLLAMERALTDLPVTPDEVLVDGSHRVPAPYRQQVIPHGDATILAIACASIVAKVHRDALMRAYAREFPAYGFERHKGYPTAHHLAALRSYGPSPIHRRSFRPVRELVAPEPVSLTRFPSPPCGEREG